MSGLCSCSHSRCVASRIATMSIFQVEHRPTLDTIKLLCEICDFFLTTIDDYWTYYEFDWRMTNLLQKLTTSNIERMFNENYRNPNIVIPHIMAMIRTELALGNERLDKNGCIDFCKPTILFRREDIVSAFRSLVRVLTELVHGSKLKESINQYENRVADRLIIKKYYNLVNFFTLTEEQEKLFGIMYFDDTFLQRLERPLDDEVYGDDDDDSFPLEFGFPNSLPGVYHSIFGECDMSILIEQGIILQSAFIDPSSLSKTDIPRETIEGYGIKIETPYRDMWNRRDLPKDTERIIKRYRRYLRDYKEHLPQHFEW